MAELSSDYETNTFLPNIFSSNNSSIDGDDIQKVNEESDVIIVQATSESSDSEVSNEDEKDTEIDEKLLSPSVLTNREKLRSRSFDSLVDNSRTVKFEETLPSSSKEKMTSSEENLQRNVQKPRLARKIPLKQLSGNHNRSYSESNLSNVQHNNTKHTRAGCPCANRQSIFSDQRKCSCSCRSVGQWNTSTKLPPIKITNNGKLYVNRDFCYRVINPRAVIEKAILDRRGYCATCTNSSGGIGKSKNTEKKLPSTKKSTNKYTPSRDIIPVAADASHEFKTVIRTQDLWPSKKD